MWPGPVFNVELMTTARRARYYFVRAFYGLILLYLLWQTYEASFRWRFQVGGKLSIAEMSQFASTIFVTIVVAELVGVLVLTPTLVAPVIADEKQRKTLHYLLASRLSSAEIVLGKLMARLLNLGIFLAIALPIISLITLFGGVDPTLVLISFAGIASVSLFVASVSIWVSTISRRVRDAILSTYLLVLAWLILPPLIESLRWIWPSVYHWVGPANQWLLMTNPFVAGALMFGPAAMGSGVGGTTNWNPFFYFVGTQLVASVVLVTLSVWRLRPIYQKQADAPKRVGWLGRRRRIRLIRRPDCGDNPMIWKEMHLMRSGGLLRWLIRFLAAVGILFMGYWVVYYTIPAFKEILVYGFVPSSDWGSDRQGLNYCLRTCLTILYIIFTLGAATAAASSVTSEREEDTWTSLTTTLLTGRDILLAKIIGAFWSIRFLGGVMVFLGLLGLITGAIHPIGLLVGLVEWSVFSWFAVALGIRLSLRSRNTTRATAGTVALLVMLNGGYLMCCIPMRSDTSLTMLGCTPALFTTSLMGYHDLYTLLGWSSVSYPTHYDEIVAANIIGLLFYGVGAVWLTFSSFEGFDSAIDRPVRQVWTSPPPEKLKTPRASGEL